MDAELPRPEGAVHHQPSKSPTNPHDEEIIRRLAKYLQDEVFKAMADPTRRQILRMLGKGEMPAGRIAERFEMSAPSVSHHLAVLKGADLIEARREGQQIVYSLNTTVVQDLMTVLMDLFSPHEEKK